MFYHLYLSLPIKQIKLPLKDELSNILKIDFTILKKSLDARRKGQIKLNITVKAELNDKKLKQLKYICNKITIIHPPPLLEERGTGGEAKPLTTHHSPLIIGTGPSGLFCALRLLDHGVTSTLIEQGNQIEERAKKVQEFWQNGKLDLKSNVQFGEGGAGTFSDGKLTTSKNNLNIEYILKKFQEWGAPEEILYDSKPHIGTDQLQKVIINLRNYLISKGCTIKFNSEATDFVIKDNSIKEIIVNNEDAIPTEIVVLAIGNSSRKLFKLLHKYKVAMQVKNFAVGFRVEHPQKLIDEIQYGKDAGHSALPPADYKLTFNKNNFGIYSFCMCPGGKVIAATSETEKSVTNGMSIFARNSGFANSALVVSVNQEFLSKLDGPKELRGLLFQEILEKKTFELGGNNYFAPAQRLTNYLENKTESSPINCTYNPGIVNQNLNKILPEELNSALKEGIRFFDQKMKGFITQEAVLIGTETRTSSPITIERTKHGNSLNTLNLFPCGEGAGYAGGIMSSALDGIQIADNIAKQHF